MSKVAVILEIFSRAFLNDPVRYLPGGFVCRWVDKSCCNVHSSWRSYFLQLGFKGLLIQEEHCCCQNSKGEGKEIPLRHCLRNLKILYDKSSLHFVLVSFYHKTLPGQLKTTHHWWIHCQHFLPDTHSFEFSFSNLKYSVQVFLSMYGKYKTF